MTADDMKAELATANEQSKSHWENHLRWQGVAQWLAGKLNEEAKKAKGQKAEPPTS